MNAGMRRYAILALILLAACVHRPGPRLLCEPAVHRQLAKRYVDSKGGITDVYAWYPHCKVDR